MDTEIRVSRKRWPWRRKFSDRPKAASFWSHAWHSNHWAIPALCVCVFHHGLKWAATEHSVTVSVTVRHNSWQLCFKNACLSEQLDISDDSSPVKFCADSTSTPVIWDETKIVKTVVPCVLTGGHWAEELCRSRGGRPGLPVPNKVMVCMVSVEGKQHLQKMCYYYSVSITITVLVLASK